MTQVYVHDLIKLNSTCEKKVFLLRPCLSGHCRASMLCLMQLFAAVDSGKFREITIFLLELEE